MRIGIFGGTFNPPHLGHKHLAEEIKAKAELDKIIIIPANTPPHKESKELADGFHRMKMCELLFNEELFSDAEAGSDPAGVSESTVLINVSEAMTAGSPASVSYAYATAFQEKTRVIIRMIAVIYLNFLYISIVLSSYIHYISYFKFHV